MFNASAMPVEVIDIKQEGKWVEFEGFGNQIGSNPSQTVNISLRNSKPKLTRFNDN